MDRVRVGPVKGLKIAVAAFVLSVLLFAAVVGLGIYILTNQSDETQDFSAQLREGLVTSCEVNGNPLREAVRNQIQEQIRQREHLDYARFFPNVPPEELKLLLEQQNEADRATLAEIAPVDCSEQYPKP